MLPWLIVTGVVLLLGVALLFRGIQRFQSAGGMQGLAQAAMQERAAQPPISRPTPIARVASAACILSLVAGLIALGVGGWFQAEEIRRARLLQAEGTVTTATVVEKRTTTSKGSTSYYVRYGFSTAAGDSRTPEFTREERVSEDFYRTVEQGSKIEVIYARSEPGVSRLVAQYRAGTFSYFPVTIGGVFGLPLLALSYWQWRQYLQALRLDAEGMTMMAKVVSLYKKPLPKGGTAHYVSYELPDGQAYRHTISSGVFQRLQVGDAVQVRYLPNDPRVFRLE